MVEVNVLTGPRGNVFIYLFNWWFTPYTQKYFTYTTATIIMQGIKKGGAWWEPTTIHRWLKTFPLTAREVSSMNWTRTCGVRVGATPQGNVYAVSSSMARLTVTSVVCDVSRFPVFTLKLL